MHGNSEFKLQKHRADNDRCRKERDEDNEDDEVQDGVSDNSTFPELRLLE